MLTKYLIIFALLFGISCGQTDVDVSSILSNVSLPPELKGKLDPKAVEEVQNKTLSDIKSRCEKNGGPDAYTKAQNASQDLIQCITRLVNVSSLQQEIEDAKPNGRVDEVFKNYCDKKPQFEGCMHNFTETSKACFSEKEQVHLKTVYNISQQLAEFICFKEGDRIALFIAEGGQECFQEKQEGLKDCANKTLGMDQALPMDKNLDVNSLSDFTLSFDEKQCKQILDLQNCVVTVLETCPKPTSANIVESLFKFIRKSTPCKKYADEEPKPRSHNHKAEDPKKGSASRIFVTSLTLVAALAVSLLV